jgi:hypothetical protein
MVQYLPTPVCVKLFNSLRCEYAIFFLVDHVSPSLIEWHGARNVRRIIGCAEDYDRSFVHSWAIVRRLQGLSMEQLAQLAHCLDKHKIYTTPRLAELFVLAGDPAAFTTCPFLRQYRGDDNTLDAAFRSGCVEMVRFVVEAWGKTIPRDCSIPDSETVIYVCAVGGELYAEFRALLPPRVRKILTYRQVESMSFQNIPALTVEAWERVFCHLVLTGKIDWSFVLCEVAGDCGKTGASLYTYLKEYMPKVWETLVLYSEYKRYAYDELFDLVELMRADGFAIPWEEEGAAPDSASASSSA